MVSAFTSVSVSAALSSNSVMVFLIPSCTRIPGLCTIGNESSTGLMVILKVWLTCWRKEIKNIQIGPHLMPPQGQILPTPGVGNLFSKGAECSTMIPLPNLWVAKLLEVVAWTGNCREQETTCSTGSLQAWADRSAVSCLAHIKLGEPLCLPSQAPHGSDDLGCSCVPKGGRDVLHFLSPPGEDSL